MHSQVFDRSRILNLTLVLESALLLVAAFWFQLAQLNLLSEFVFTSKFLLVGILGGLATSLSGFAIVFVDKLFGNSIKWMGSLRQIVYSEIVPLFKDLRFTDIVLIALSSGFCEEVFFRGVMQPQIGIVPTSVLFGMVHCPSPRYLTYGLWATAAGLFLGYLRDYTGSVWAPIFAHGLSNLLVITYFRYVIKTAAT